MRALNVVLFVFVGFGAVDLYRNGLGGRPLDEALLVGLTVGLVIFFASAIDGIHDRIDILQRRLDERGPDAT